MFVSEASRRGYDRGHALAQTITDEDFGVLDEVKDECECECVRGYVDLFCRLCARRTIMENEESARKAPSFADTATDLNHNHASHDPARDASVLWDAFNEGVVQGVDEALAALLPPDKEMRMAVHSRHLLGSIRTKQGVSK